MPFSAIERVIELMRMPAVHNSYGCPAIDPRAAVHAVNLLIDLPDDTPLPVIVPETTGFGMEFHGREAVKVVVTPDGLFGVSGNRKEEGVVQVWKLLVELK